MFDMLNSPSVRSGNVLALLDTLYTSGFAMATPTIPILKGRTMHTLYAVSFIVCVCNSISDWIHVWATLQGHVMSFPLEPWLAVLLVVVSVGGSMITWLLMVLCMENAFAHRLDVTPYRSGCALILESIIDWIQAFNNFRVMFLVMILHDAPLTFINFFFIPSCRCAGPSVSPWTLLLSSSTTIVSLSWRITMLYFAYRRMLCPLRKTPAAPTLHTVLTPREHFESAIDTSTGGRIDEFDECWPVRFSRLRVYGRQNSDDDMHKQVPSIGIRDVPSLLTLPVISHVISFIILIVQSILDICRLVLCIILSLLGYLFLCITCCIPYCYHYTCRKNSFHHRHKCARSFIRYGSSIFHYCIFGFSLCFSLLLIAFNMALISSVHVIGSNSLPPEIDRVCVTMVPRTHTIYTTILSQKVLSTRRLSESVNADYMLIDNRSFTSCKPLWEDGGLGLGLKRKGAGPWQTRKKIEQQLLAVSTQVLLINIGPEEAYLQLLFDFAILQKREEHEHPICLRANQTQWSIVFANETLDWPYFVGCKKDWRYQESVLIECFDDKKIENPSTRAPRIPDGWRRSKTHRTRHRQHKTSILN